MAFLPDIQISALSGDDPKQQIDSVVAQLNEWGRMVSNESLTRIYKSDGGTEAITIGQVEGGLNGLLIRDETGTPRAIFGQLPDGEIGIVISRPGNNVLELFD